MFLRSIKIRDWKAYASATFDFPVPTKNKNVVLIGAKNGYGKTSLLEALILGLYGRDGMNTLGRAITANTETEKTYDEFVERALHAQAIQQGRTSISIEIVLEDAAERLKIVRKWHFTGQGKHRRDQEDVQLYAGKDEEPIRVPGLRPSREEIEDYYGSLIARKFIPFHLTEFFLFDGERVQQLAKQQKADTVKMGIEGILGVQLLRELQQDLKDYAQNRRSGAEQIEDETLARINDQIAEIETRLEPCRRQIKQHQEQTAPVSQRIEELTKTLRTMTGGGIENVRELQEEKFQFQRQKEKVEERLNLLIRSDLAFALAGSVLRGRVGASIRGEIKRSEWLASKNHTRQQLDRILAGLEDEEPAIVPALTEHQLTVLRQRISTAWEKLWHPPPSDCASEERHAYLTEAERRKVVDRLEKIEQLGVAELQQLLADHEEATEKIDKRTREIAQLSGVEDRIREVTDELQRLNQLVQGFVSPPVYSGCRVRPIPQRKPRNPLAA